MPWSEHAPTRKRGREEGKGYRAAESMITDTVASVELAPDFQRRIVAMKRAGPVRLRRRTPDSASMRASEATITATAAVQISGANGLSDKYRVNRLFRGAKVFRVIEGNNLLHRAMVAEYALRFPGSDP